MEATSAALRSSPSACPASRPARKTRPCSRPCSADAAYMDPTRGAAHLVGAQGDAMRAAAANTSAGPAMAFMGVNAAAAAGGADAQTLYQMGARQAAAQPAPAPAAGWKCCLRPERQHGQILHGLWLLPSRRHPRSGCAAAAPRTAASSAPSAANPARRPSAPTAAGSLPTPPGCPSSARNAASPLGHKGGMNHAE